MAQWGEEAASSISVTYVSEAVEDGLILQGANDEASSWDHTFVLVFLCAFFTTHTSSYFHEWEE